MCLLNKVPRVPKCPSALSAQVPRRPYAWVPKCLKCPSARVPFKFPSALQIPECHKSPSARVPKCLPSALWVHSECLSVRVLPNAKMFKCPQSVFKCTSLTWMSNQMWLDKILSIKICFICKKKEMQKEKKW